MRRLVTWSYPPSAESDSEPSPPLRSRTHRHGAVLVCVLVVLLIVGGLALQAMQTMSIIRRGDDRRQTVRQAHELIELGRHLESRSAISEGQPLTFDLSKEAKGTINISRIDTEAMRLQTEYQSGPNRIQKASQTIPSRNTEASTENFDRK